MMQILLHMQMPILLHMQMPFYSIYDAFLTFLIKWKWSLGVYHLNFYKVRVKFNYNICLLSKQILIGIPWWNQLLIKSQIANLILFFFTAYASYAVMMMFGSL